MTTIVRRPAATLAALAASLLLLLALAPAASASPPGPLRDFALTSGHIDLFDLAYDPAADGLALRVGDGTRLYSPDATLRAPEQVSVVVDRTRSATDVSGEQGDLRFLRVDGDTVYRLSQLEDPALPWPGWSTERLVASLPAGVQLPADGQPVRLAIDVEGPGNLFAWQTDAAGAVSNRYVDTSDDVADAIPVARDAHVHTNWAFTALGDYLVTVTPTATTTDGATISGAPATYHFHVGDADELDAPQSTDAPTLGGDVRVGGTVTADPGAWTPTAAGHRYRWLRDGEPIPGATGESYRPTADDYARALAVEVTAVVPGRHAGRATSAAVAVADADGHRFEIDGIEGAYDVGDTIDARLTGYQLGDGELFSWRVRQRGHHGDGIPMVTLPDDPTRLPKTDPLTIRDDGTELAVKVYRGDQIVASTAWVPLVVRPVDGERPALTRTDPGAGLPTYAGDVTEFTAGGRTLGPGETLKHYLVSGTTWRDWSSAIGRLVGTHVETATPGVHEMVLTPGGISLSYQLAQVIVVERDGVEIARSPAAWPEPLATHELQIGGISPIYREGGTVSADATIYPLRDGDEWTYTWRFRKGSGTPEEIWGAEHQPTPQLSKGDLEKAAHDTGTLTLSAYNHGNLAATAKATLAVTDQTGGQLVALGLLNGHYHQTDTVKLTATIDPAPLPGDRIAWEWRWPGSDSWNAIPGADVPTLDLPAEQALHEVQLRVRFVPATGDEIASDPRTILVDDHGAAADQVVGISGETSVVAGGTVDLDATVSPSTVLTAHRWERRAAGSDEWVAVEGQGGARMTFAATDADDGAQYRVSLLLPDGTVAYGPSQPVTLAVAPAPEPEPEPEPGPTPGDDPVLPLPDPSVLLPPAPTPPAPDTTPTVAATTSITVGRVRQVYGRGARLPVTVSGRASGTIVVRFGGRTLRATLRDGRASVPLPARAAAPGARRVTVAYDGVPGRFAPSRGRGTVRVAKATPRLTVAAVRASTGRGRTAAFRVRVTAAGVRPTGTLRLRVAGRTRTVALGRRGATTVQIALPRTARGTQQVRLSYGGDRYVAAGSRRATVRTVG